MKRLLVMVFACALMLPAVADASGNPARFLSAIKDVPLMPGMHEDTERTFVFDKPEGKIVETVIVLNVVTLAQAQEFFSENLPPLGWERTANGTFLRDGERLTIAADSGQDPAALRVTLAPAPTP